MQSIVLRFLHSLLGMVRMLAISFSLTLITTLMMTSPTQADVVHVNHASTALNPDGTEWALAFRFLSQGLAAAEEGDLVYVAAGEYRPDESPTNPNGPTPPDRSLFFALKKGVKVYGGFLPGDTFEERDPETNLTYLHGDLAGDDADANANGIPDGFEVNPPDYSDMAENSIHIVAALSIPASGQQEEVLIDDATVLDGFIVRGTNANGSGVDVLGAGLFCGGATSGGPDHTIDIKSSPTVARTRFDFNHAGNGVGGYAAAIYSSYGDAVLRDLCTFADNHSDTCGGATLQDHGDFTVLGCTYQNNRAGRNSAAHQSRSPTGTTRIHSCQFIDNIVVGEQAQRAGAIMLLGTAGELLNTEFRGNLAPREGGAAYLQNTTVTNCTFSGNQTTDATSGRPGTGGIYAVTGVTIKNTILWGNTSNNGTVEEQQINGSYSATYSDIETGEDCDPLPCVPNPPVSGTNNINEDPDFKAIDNLRLTSCSPCIDVGDYDDPDENPVPDFPFPDDDFDINNDGDYDEATPDVQTKKRIVNGDDTTGAVLDMGAHEYDPVCPEDLSDSGEVDGTDLALLLGAWTAQEQDSPCPDEDLNGDCRVNGFDLAILLGAWGDCLGVCNQDFGPGGGGEGGEEEEDGGTIAQLVAWYLAGDMAAIIQWLIEQGY